MCGGLHPMRVHGTQMLPLLRAVPGPQDAAFTVQGRQDFIHGIYRQKARWGMNLSEEGNAALSGRICPAPLPGRRNFLSIKIPLYRVIQRLNNLNAPLMCLGSGSCTEDEPTP